MRPQSTAQTTRCTETLRAAMDAGAKAYIVKSQAGRDLVPAILAAARGERYVAQNEHETS